MTKELLLRAIHDALYTHIHGAGVLSWNNGTVRCFLYDGRWFPLRATVNHARALAGLEEVNSNRCSSELSQLVSPFKLSIQDVNLVANQLGIADEAQRQMQKGNVWVALNELNALRELVKGF
jgi:hypothetical protein